MKLTQNRDLEAAVLMENKEAPKRGPLAVLARFFASPYRFIQIYFVLLYVQSLFFVSPKMQNYLNYAFLLWGFALLGRELVFRRRLLQRRELYCYAASYLLGLLTIFLNREAGQLIYSLKTWCLPVLVFGLFYPYFFIRRELRSPRQAFCGLVRPLVYLGLLVHLLSLLTFVLNYTGYIFRHDVGFYWGVRYVFRDSGAVNPLLIGLYNEPNYAALLAFCLFLLGLFLRFEGGRSRLEQMLLNLHLGLCVVFIVLANSRGATLGCLLFLLIFGLRYLLQYWRAGRACGAEASSQSPAALRLPRSLALILVALLLCSIFGGPLRRLSYKIFLYRPLTRVTVVQYGAVLDASAQPKELVPGAPFIRIRRVPLKWDYVGRYLFYLQAEPRPEELEELDEALDISADKENTNEGFEGLGNGRVGRWVESLSLVTRHRPLQGTSPRGVRYFAQKYADYRRLAEGQNTVNSYLSYLLYYGWPCFLLFMSFLGLALWPLLKRYFQRPGPGPVELLFLAGLGGILCQAFFLSAVLENLTAYSALLGFILGACRFYPWEAEHEKS